MRTCHLKIRYLWSLKTKTLSDQPKLRCAPGSLCYHICHLNAVASHSFKTKQLSFCPVGRGVNLVRCQHGGENHSHSHGKNQLSESSPKPNPRDQNAGIHRIPWGLGEPRPRLNPNGCHLMDPTLSFGTKLLQERKTKKLKELMMNEHQQ